MLSFSTVTIASLIGMGVAFPMVTPGNLGNGFPDLVRRNGTLGDTYTAYTGDGSAAAGWPSIDQWPSYDDLWQANQEAMSQSCSWNGWGADNTAAESDAINSAITQVAGSSGVDARFILAIVMQESKGCVRVPTTDNGVTNPGLMQSHAGTGTCAGVSPCPQDQILQMIKDGTEGTPEGDGLQQLFQQTSGHLGQKDAQAYYAAARGYNSGSIDYTNLDNGFTSTACYAEDVANRLHGWVMAPTACTA